MRISFLWLALAVFYTPALAQTSPQAAATVSSPDGTLSVSVMTDGDGRPSYAVSRSGTPVIAPSRLGFILTDAPKLERNLVATADAATDHDDTWEQPWGERRFIRNHYRELRIHLTERTALARTFDVVFRVYDDGLGFRYEFPQQAALPVLRIGSELTEFNIAEDGEAWWIPSHEWNREEYLYHRTAIEEASNTQTPLTMRLASGLHLSIHEAALVDYAGMNLRRAEGRRFVADLTPGFTNAAVERPAPFPTPWRTIQISDTAGGLVESSLILNLNDPNTLGDVSWFKPMKYVGIWWEMHLDKATWASGPRHGATTANTRHYIDFAAANGFGGVLVEGWNLGWDGDWFGNGSDYSFTRPYPDFDLEGLAAYARERGVQLIGHHETGGNAFNYEQQMADAFALDQRLGITMVKTGYVADAGGAQVAGPDGRSTFAWNESQAMARHHIRVLEAAAADHVAINSHEPIKDTGLRRTYPNWVSREGARGMEFNAWGQPGNPPEHEVNLVFTRLLAGPMDFTPGIFGMVTRSPDGVATTWAKQLALYVTIYSPIQMAADLPENYESNPGPFQFIRDVAVDWDETHVLNGEIGDYVTIVRKTRGGREWFLGSITDENPRVLSASLSFLEPGVRYRAEIYRDGPNASWRDGPGPDGVVKSRTDIVIEQREVTSAETLTLHLAPGGGQAIRFVPLGRAAR